MQVGNSFFNNQVNFGKAYSTKQKEEEFLPTKEKVENALYGGNQICVGKFYAQGLPASKGNDTGVGHLNSPEGYRMVENLRDHAGANMVKTFPLGQLGMKPAYQGQGYYGAYQRSSLTIGEDYINIDNLATPQYANILSEEDVKDFAAKHTAGGEVNTKIDYKNTLGQKLPSEYPINEPLSKAFKNFKEMPATPELEQLREEFNNYKTSTDNDIDIQDIHSRMVLAPILVQSGKKDFFKGFDKDPAIREQKMPEYEQMKKDHAEEIEFFQFKQFIAEKEVATFKENINKMGVGLMVDQAIGFSYEEEVAFPDAFLDGNNGNKASLGWGLPVQDVEALSRGEEGPAKKLLHDKTVMNLRRADGIRFDVGWSHAKPIFDKGNGMQHMEVTDKIFHMFEDWATEIKGEDFDQRKLVYEFDANCQDFDLVKNRDFFKGIKGMLVLTSSDERYDYKSTKYLKEKVGLNEDQILHGTNNHDRESIIEVAESPKFRDDKVGAWMDVRGESDWTKFKDNNNVNANNKKVTLANLVNSYIMKNHFSFYNDVLGRRDKVDTHWANSPSEEYRCRLEPEYESNWQKGVQSGYGMNLMSVYKEAMEIKGLDKTMPDLYQDVAALAAHFEAEGVTTQEEADALEQKEGYKSIIDKD